VDELVQRLTGSALAPVTAHLGENAIEDAFKRVARPRLLVAITHGYFLEDEPEDLDGAAVRGGAGEQLGRLRNQEDPMLRSGLVLAGANQVDAKLTATAVSADDGWLTASEIARLDLRGTELVVLSACNSGSGSGETGQAVAGLRSAILLAGAETMIGSLFAAPDRETRELMVDFYDGLLAGRGKLASLQQARLAMIARRRAEHGAAHPFFWASFVLVGKP
jgi:hypothetical protein